MNCNAIFDKYYNAVSGSPEFFSFIGAKNLTSLLRNAHNDDISKIKSVFETLVSNQTSYLVVRLKCYNNDFEWVIMSFKLLESDDDLKNTYVEIYTIEDFKSIINEKNLSIQEYRGLLSILEEIYFEYIFQNQNIRFYWINKNQNINIYSGNFLEWKNYMLENNYIKKKNISIFERLCKDIQNGAHKFCYKIPDSTIYADDEFVYNIFKGMTLFLDDKPYKAIGTLMANEKNTEIGIAKTSIDFLTGLLNKEAFVKYANEIINKKPDYFVNVVIIDIDNFKLINDTFGHLFGDEIIKQIADTISDIVKDRGVIGRFGGDEFVIIFTGFNDNMELRSYLKSIRMTIERKFKSVRGKVDLTASIGTSKYPVDGLDYDNLFRKADTCLYIAKEKGKNRYIICDEVAYIANYEKKDKKNIISIESREKMAGFICSNINILIKKRKNGIFDVIKSVGENRNLSRVAVFFGKSLKMFELWGSSKDIFDNAMYIYKGDYLSNFNSNGVFIIHSSATIEIKNPDVYSAFSYQNIYSAIQCLIFDNDREIIGLISFEKSFQRKGWTENEIYNFTIITFLIGEILKGNI